MNSHLGIRVQHDTDVTWVSISGELDLASSRDLADELDTLCAAFPAIVLDLSDVAFIDSSGVQSLCAAAERANEAGTDLFLGPISAEAQRILRLMGAETRIDRYPPVFRPRLVRPA